MSYTSSPYAAKARFDAANLVVKDGQKISAVAIEYGVNKSTIWRWVKRYPGKTRKLNQYGHFIPTLSSAPDHHPNQTPDEIVEEIVRLRKKLGRCAPVIFLVVLAALVVLITGISMISIRKEGIMTLQQQLSALAQARNVKRKADLQALSQALQIYN